ncbi:hypothetical protein D7X87_16560 [bacterium D16-54]|nr:hypothetical protein D7X87_16560 [bacterium D16-54]RKJ13346.1 hypothetical protein D7X65_16695 [bacterium D16-56]
MENKEMTVMQVIGHCVKRQPGLTGQAVCLGKQVIQPSKQVIGQKMYQSAGICGRLWISERRRRCLR